MTKFLHPITIKLMVVVQKMPRKLEEALGVEASSEFIDLLNHFADDYRQIIIQAVEDRFGKIVTEEISKVRLELANLDVKIANYRSEIKTEIANLDVRIANLDVRIANLRSEFKADFASQTKWILVAIISVTVLLPFFTELVKKLFHS